MDQDTTQGAAASFAAQAFGELRAEVSLLRRAVERLTDERAATPDYTPSLEAISKRLEDVDAWAEEMSEQPALQLTPESLTRQINAAASDSRAADHARLERAGQSMQAAGDRIDALITRSRSVYAQNEELKKNRIGFAVAGMLVFAILPGAIARSLPVSWAIPERIAARMLGLDMWEAGQDMMAKADPKRWDGIVERERERALRLSRKSPAQK